MKKQTIFALLVAFALGATAEARPFDVTLWRGETAAFRFWGSSELGKDAPKEFTLKRGTLKSVKYAPSPKSLERLEKLDRVVWDEDEARPDVIEVSVPSSTKAGVYTCGELRVKVLDRFLPPAKEWKYFLDLWQHPWAVARIHDVKPFSRGHYKAMKKSWEVLATAGQKTLTVTLVDEPWNHQCFDAYHSMIGRVKKADGTWEFDYSIFDEYVEFGRACGIGPDIACYTMCPWNYVCRYENEKGEVQAVTCNPGTKEFEDFWGDFLVDFAAHLKAKGWFEDTYIAMDERTPEDVKNIATFIQKKVPGMKIAMAGNRKPSDFVGITIDNYSQLLDYVTPEFMKEVKERQAKGYKTTYYVCCIPYFPNTFLSSGDGEAFWMGAFPGVIGLDGMLRWAWNSWPKNPKEDASYDFWASGDTFLVYPDGEPSWRFLELRSGIIAAEKLRILKEQNLFTKEIGELEKIYKVQEAIQNKSDFKDIRGKTLQIVNQ